ncbi:MAG: HAD family hydrolase [Hyphomicrobiaceae bacterium]
MRTPTVVFDLDGTLVDTAPDLAHATNHALSRIGIPAVALETVRASVSHGARAMLVKALDIAGWTLPDAEIDDLLTHFLDFYGENIAVESRPYPDAVEVVKGLKGRGMRLAVCTNKREGMSRKLLKELGMLDLFSAVVGRDTLPVYKPDPGHLIGTVILADGDLGRTVMVGDSETDVLTAKAAGIPVIGVTFGYTHAPIASFGPDAVIDHYRDLANAVDMLAAARVKGG